MQKKSSPCLNIKNLLDRSLTRREKTEESDYSEQHIKEKKKILKLLQNITDKNTESESERQGM